METPARFTFDGPLEGNTATVFPIAAEIKGDNYCRVELDDVIVGDLTKYDIVNNSIVFTNAADLVGVTKVSVLVVQSEEAAATFPAVGFIGTVADNIINVRSVIGKENRNVSQIIMLNEEKALTLKSSINEYKNLLNKFITLT